MCKTFNSKIEIKKPMSKNADVFFQDRSFKPKPKSMIFIVFAKSTF